MKISKPRSLWNCHFYDVTSENACEQAFYDIFTENPKPIKIWYTPSDFSRTYQVENPWLRMFGTEATTSAKIVGQKMM